MEFQDINERLDLDNYIAKEFDKIPLNNDDTAIYIRSKLSTGELLICTKTNTENFAVSLLNIAAQNDDIKDILFLVVNELKALNN